MANSLPYIPEYITVHLGTPSSNAANVTVSFQEYVYNVASSEIYPTWEPSALRANILAIISFALNRIYTEYYPSRGYAFNITSSTTIDQKFIQGRNYFDSIVTIVDEIFNNYIRRVGTVQPLATSFCNGTTVTCPGMSQWGSQALAQQGRNSVQILKHYYGENIELVVNAPIRDFQYSYSGTVYRLGSVGRDVAVIQASLNQIAQNYPSIPTVLPADGVFGAKTERSVRVFQGIFNLTVDGIVGKATWYKLVQLYVAILRLNELDSEGLTQYEVVFQYSGPLQEGSSGVQVVALQQMLALIGEFIPEVPSASVTGYYDAQTASAVSDFQTFAGLPVTGTIDAETWDAIYNQYAGIVLNTLDAGEVFPAALTYPGTPLMQTV